MGITRLNATGYGNYIVQYKWLQNKLIKRPKNYREFVQ